MKAPAPVYLGPAAHTSAGSNRPIRRIVIHCTVSPCEAGGARATAAYFREQAAGGSAHYVVDPGEVVQSVFDNVIAWHAPPNANSLGVELCDPMVYESGPHKGEELPAARWDDANHAAMLDRAAELVAQLALAYKVPIRQLGVADLLAGKHGICGHVDVSQAFKQSTHWDPGAHFPWDSFMARVHAHARKLLAPPLRLFLESAPLHTERPDWAAKAPAQVSAAAARGAHVIGFTEVRQPALADQLGKLVAAHGYRWVHFPEADVALAVKNTLRRVSTSCTIVDGRGRLAVSFRHGGEAFTVFGIHFDTNTPAHKASRLAQLEGLIAAVDDANATSLPFFLGDTNPDGPLRVATSWPRATLDSAGMVLAYEEAGFPKSVGVNTIGRSRAGGRVRCVDVQTHDALGSDHVPVTATYEIAPS